MAMYWDTDVTLVGDLPSRDLEVSALLRGEKLNYKMVAMDDF